MDGGANTSTSSRVRAPSRDANVMAICLVHPPLKMHLCLVVERRQCLDEMGWTAHITTIECINETNINYLAWLVGATTVR